MDTTTMAVPPTELVYLTRAEVRDAADRAGRRVDVAGATLARRHSREARAARDEAMRVAEYWRHTAGCAANPALCGDGLVIFED